MPAGWPGNVDWSQPDWDLLRTRVDADLIVSTVDTSGLTMRELQWSWLPGKDRGSMRCAPRPLSRLCALSVAAEGWLKHNGHLGLHRWLREPWRGEEPLVDLIREEGREAADVILDRMMTVISDQPCATVLDLYAQRHWMPAPLPGQDAVFRQRFDPAAAPLGLFGLEDGTVARALGVSAYRAAELQHGATPMRWERFLLGALFDVVEEARDRDWRLRADEWLRTPTGSGFVLADEFAMWDADSLAAIEGCMPKRV